MTENSSHVFTKIIVWVCQCQGLSHLLMPWNGLGWANKMHSFDKLTMQNWTNWHVVIFSYFWFESKYHT